MAFQPFSDYNYQVLIGSVIHASMVHERVASRGCDSWILDCWLEWGLCHEWVRSRNPRIPLKPPRHSTAENDGGLSSLGDPLVMDKKKRKETGRRSTGGEIIMIWQHTENGGSINFIFSKSLIMVDYAKLLLYVFYYYQWFGPKFVLVQTSSKIISYRALPRVWQLSSLIKRTYKQWK